MKKKILLVDGYNMIAFWQETRQLFKKNQLDEARNILLRKLNNYAHFENLVFLMRNMFLEFVNAMTNIKFKSSLQKKTRLQILTLNVPLLN